MRKHSLIPLVLLGLGVSAFWVAKRMNGGLVPAAPLLGQEVNERLVERFVQLRNAKDRAAFDLLGPAPVFDEQPVSGKTAEARQTDYFLRSGLRFVEVLPGEPDASGKLRAAKGRYTLITRGPVTSPKLIVRSEKGVEAPEQLNMFNPDLVVEVRDGKIYGVRSELHVGE